MSRPHPSLDPMKVLGALKLPEEDAQKFLEALHAYGYERSAAFLRRCAYTLIEHHAKKDKLNQPLSFELGRRYSVFEPRGE